MSLAVEYQQVSLGYGRGRMVLSGIDVVIHRGEFVGIIGPNGSGKSTLLRALFGLGITVEGTIRILGQERAQADLWRLGYVPQRPDVDPLFPVTVLDVALMGRAGRAGLLRRFGGSDMAAANDALAFVNMAHLASQPFGQLSGGQKQRVLIAQALAQAPDILVFDEALNGLDFESQQEVIGLTRELHRQGRTMLFVMHNFNELARYCTSIILVNAGTVQIGPPRDILTPETLRTVFYIDPAAVEGCLERDR
jgi:ABC-type Mn2+/Zn2+ transport system ATPase subunit